MKIYVDIDGTICESLNSDYPNSKPIQESIDKINKLFNEGNTIIYWTARGQNSGIDWTELTNTQLREWGCLFHEIICNEKPNYDLMICDKTKRIEEI
jgi:hypothetical protein